MQEWSRHLDGGTLTHFDGVSIRYRLLGQGLYYIGVKTGITGINP